MGGPQRSLGLVREARADEGTGAAPGKSAIQPATWGRRSAGSDRCRHERLQRWFAADSVRTPSNLAAPSRTSRTAARRPLPPNDNVEEEGAGGLTTIIEVASRETSSNELLAAVMLLFGVWLEHTDLTGLSRDDC